MGAAHSADLVIDNVIQLEGGADALSHLRSLLTRGERVLFGQLASQLLRKQEEVSRWLSVTGKSRFFYCRPHQQASPHFPAETCRPEWAEGSLCFNAHITVYKP